MTKQEVLQEIQQAIQDCLIEIQDFAESIQEDYTQYHDLEKILERSAKIYALEKAKENILLQNEWFDLLSSILSNNMLLENNSPTQTRFQRYFIKSLTEIYLQYLKYLSP